MKIKGGRDVKVGGDVSEGEVRKKLNLDKFWENIDTIGWVVAVVVMVGVIGYLAITEKQVPQVLTTALGVAVGKIAPKVGKSQ